MSRLLRTLGLSVRFCLGPCSTSLKQSVNVQRRRASTSGIPRAIQAHVRGHASRLGMRDWVVDGDITADACGRRTSSTISWHGRWINREEIDEVDG